MTKETIHSNQAPEPVGAYPHARKVGDLLFLSGIGPRKKNSKEIFSCLYLGKLMVDYI